MTVEMTEPFVWPEEPENFEKYVVILTPFLHFNPVSTATAQILHLLTFVQVGQRNQRCSRRVQRKAKSPPLYRRIWPQSRSTTQRTQTSIGRTSESIVIRERKVGADVEDVGSEKRCCC
jgi:hypothetical protein